MRQISDTTATLLEIPRRRVATDMVCDHVSFRIAINFFTHDEDKNHISRKDRMDMGKRTQEGRIDKDIMRLIAVDFFFRKT